ncbi:hypothetical protein JCM10450v2_001308 [Rhodotorula kratochvilovae]
MCQSGAHLFYGIKVPLVQLAIAADAFPKQRDAFLAIDLILARRRKGVLRDAASELGLESGIADLPEEVWVMVKEEVAAALWDDSENALVCALLHKEPAASNGCCDCEVWNELRLASLEKRRPTRYFTFDHVVECDICNAKFYEGVGMSDLRDDVGDAIKAMLPHFSLTTLGEYPISDEDYTATDLDAMLPVILPQYATAETEVDHNAIDTHSSLTLLPSLFVIPSDASSRFDRLLTFFPRLTSSDSPGQGTRKLELGAKRETAVEPDGFSGCGPAWTLWNWSRTCY